MHLLDLPIPLGAVVFTESEFIEVHRAGDTASCFKGSANRKSSCLRDEAHGFI